MNARRRILRWTAAGLLAAGAAAACLLDEAFVRTADPGFLPADAAWSVHAPDAGAFWRALERTEAYRALETARPQPLRAFDRKVHIRTGVRPASWRWRIWMGRTLLAAGREGGEWGVSVRPGILLRAVHLLRAPFAAKNDGVFQFADWRYGWRDGFLIASPSEAYVRDALRSAPADPGRVPERPDAMRVRLLRTPEAAFTLTAADGLPVDGYIEAPIAAGGEGLVREPAIESGAALTVYARSFADMKRAAVAVRAHTPVPKLWSAPLEEAAALLEHWKPDLPADWDGGADQAALSWMEFDLGQTPPVPGVALHWRGGAAHPLAPWAESLGAVPLEWNGEPGSVSPWLGSAVQLCLARRSGAWIAASNEPLMARIAAAETDEAEEIPAAMFVSADYELLAEWVRLLLEETGRLGIDRGVGRDDIRANYGPWLDALASMGRLRLEARADGDLLQFDGVLAEGAKVSDAP